MIILFDIFPKILNTSVFRLINYLKIKILKIQVKGEINIHGIIYYKNSGKIEFGNQNYFNSGKSFNPIGGDTRLYFWVGKTGRIKIGNRCAISNSTFVSFTGIEIGDDVFIGGGCKIYDTDFHPLNFEERKIGSKIKSVVINKPIKICNGAFIGGQSIILKGVTIGEQAIIGAGSVVTKDIPSEEIWGGNPAKFIRKLDN